MPLLYDFLRTGDKHRLPAHSSWNPLVSRMLKPILGMGGLGTEGSGQTAGDASGNNNTSILGATTGADAFDPTWVSAGKVGGALSFDGVNDYVNVGSPALLNNITPLSVAAWISPRRFPSARTRRHWRDCLMMPWALGSAWA